MVSIMTVLLDDDYLDETSAEREAREETAVVLDETSQRFVGNLVDKLLAICDELSGHPLYPYQTPLARRILESIIIGDGDTISALMARQVGKTETISDAIATAMIMLPRLAKVFPVLLGKFKEGLWVGAFAPVEEQADNLFGRIVARLSSERAAAMMADPEINDAVVGRGKVVRLRNCGSLVRKTTCHPRATIEGRTYHVILVDESQFADSYVINRSVAPMGSSTRATMIFTGTPTRNKNVFYNIIQQNRRKMTRGARPCHFQVDWKQAGKYNVNYKKFVQQEMLRLGEDSDEFKLSYRCMWMLDKGMFTTNEKLDALGDTSMQSVVHAYNQSPCVVGIDCGRKHDRTIVTVVFVDWDNPDPFGLYHHRILNWLDLEGQDWEEQFFRIKEFLANYNVWKVAIDATGLGDVVAQRMRLLIPYAEVVEILSNPTHQSVRWKHLMQLIERQQLSWPAGAKVRRLKTYRRFRQEMEDLELVYKGPLMTAVAPNTADAHDDYPDSLALACILSMDTAESNVEQYDNFFYRS